MLIKKQFKYIDLFAGIGGIRIPFDELGGRCVFSSEWDKFSQKTYEANFGEVPSGDITKIPIQQIPKHNLLLAGFPDNYIIPVSNIQAYKQFGNSVSVPVIRSLAKKLHPILQKTY